MGLSNSDGSKNKNQTCSGIGDFSIGIFVAYFLSPLIASAFMPTASTIGDMSDIGSVMDHMGKASRTAETSRTISLVALVVSFAGLVYSAVVAASWFISAAPK